MITTLVNKVLLLLQRNLLRLHRRKIKIQSNERVLVVKMVSCLPFPASLVQGKLTKICLRHRLAPAKKAKIATTTTPTVKKPPPAPTTYAPVNAVKAGSISFKKKPESTMTPMQAALAAVKEKKKLEAAAGGAAKKDAVEDASLKKKGKVKKSVRWKPDEELEAIRWIEKAIYDGDAMNALNLGEGEVSLSLCCLRQFERKMRN